MCVLNFLCQNIVKLREMLYDNKVRNHLYSAELEA